MAEQKKPVEVATAAPGEKRSVTRPPLARAAESGDPAVQKALADLQTAQQNLAALRAAQADDPAAVAAEKDARDRLGKLGFE
ncbi:MAG: hypothetical protein J2P30_00125 [Actinobacteria bacterium]|nr:hypothetical protein [Actinomycetota bacterium]